MKKYLLLLSTLFLSMSMNAQMFVGGTLSFVSEDVPLNDGKTTASAFTIAPSLGYNLSDMWSVGLELEYSTGDLYTQIPGKLNCYYNASSSSKQDNRFSLFGIAPYVRCKYFRTNLVDFFVDGGVGFANINDGTNNSRSLYFSFQPGVILNVTKHFSFVTYLGAIGYYTESSDVAGSPTFNAFDFRLTSLKDLEFGLYYNF